VRRIGIGLRQLQSPLVLAAAPAAALGYNLYLAWRGLPVVQSGFAQQWHSIMGVFFMWGDAE
jgi:hypothetical protein